MAETTAVGFEPVDKAGDTMEGPLTLAGAPTTDLEAATKKYVDDNAAAPGANTSLSNLDSPTAVNQDIVPDGGNTRDLGSESNPFKALYLKEVRVPYDGVLPQDSLNFFAWNSVTSDWDVIFGVVSGAAPGVTFAGTTAFLNGFITITPAPGDNSHKLADTAFVQQELAAYTPPATAWGSIGGTLSNQTDLQNALNSKADTSSLGNYATLLCNLNAAVDPTSGDDSSGGYDIGSRWINVNTNKEFVCVDDSVGSAVWEQTTNYNNVFIPYNPPDEFNSGNFEFREATGEAGNNRIRLRTRNAVQSNINAYLLSNQSQNYTLVGYSDVEPPYSINPIDCVLSGPQAEGTGGTEQGFASSPAIGMPMGKIQMPFGKTANYFYGPIGSHGIDITLPGIELVNDTTYFMPVKVPFAATGLRVGINVGDATGKIRFRAFAPGGSNFGGNSRPIGRSISFWTILLDNLTSQGAFNFSITSYDYSPVGYMYIAFRPEQITGTLTLADVVITDDNEALRYFGYSTLATPTPIFGYYIAGSQSLQDVDDYTNVQIPNVITQPFGINLIGD